MCMRSFTAVHLGPSSASRMRSKNGIVEMGGPNLCGQSVTWHIEETCKVTNSIITCHIATVERFCITQRMVNGTHIASIL
jgi:hypothetical protein